MKKLVEYIEQVELEESVCEGDGFHLDAGGTVIETVVLESWGDSVLILMDDVAMDMLAESGAKLELAEAEYQGRKVPLNKPMAGDVKKSKVYVKKPNGKVVKVNFGDKKLSIKKHIPKRRKSFRARHHCENPGPKWKARYWACRSW